MHMHIKNIPKTNKTEDLPNYIEIAVFALEDVLAALRIHNIDTSQWSKTPEHLLKEIQAGDTRLRVNPQGDLERHTQTLLLTIYSPDNTKRLVEDRQEYKDGIVRKRGTQWISEKHKPGEDIDKLVARAIREELFNNEDVDITGVEVRPFPVPSQEGPKSAYDGLNTVNILTSKLARLPQELYREEGYVEYQNDKTNYFVWEDVR
jgi:hypothetical protein